MIKYSGHSITDLPSKYRIITITENGELVYSKWLDRNIVPSEIDKAHQELRNIVKIEQTVDVTSDFYRL